jgi:hypothetical protein
MRRETPDPSEISQPSDILGVKPIKQIHSPYVTKIKPTIAMADQSTIKPLILETASDTRRVQFIRTGNSLFFLGDPRHSQHIGSWVRNL